MPKPRLYWFKVWIGCSRHEKVAPLSDKTFRTWVELLDAGAQQPVRGEFPSAATAAAMVRQPLPCVMELITARLLDEYPDGRIGLHDWPLWQRSASEELAANQTGLEPESSGNDTRALTGRRKKTEVQSTEQTTPVELSEARARRAHPVDEPFIVEMIADFGKALDGDDGVRDVIAAAMNHKASDKAKNKQLYVRRWLTRECQYRSERRHMKPTGTANVHP